MKLSDEQLLVFFALLMLLWRFYDFEFICSVKRYSTNLSKESSFI